MNARSKRNANKKKDEIVVEDFKDKVTFSVFLSLLS